MAHVSESNHKDRQPDYTRPCVIGAFNTDEEGNDFKPLEYKIESKTYKIRVHGGPKPVALKTPSPKPVAPKAAPKPVAPKTPKVHGGPKTPVGAENPAHKASLGDRRGPVRDPRARSRPGPWGKRSRGPGGCVSAGALSRARGIALSAVKHRKRRRGRARRRKEEEGKVALLLGRITAVSFYRAIGASGHPGAL